MTEPQRSYRPLPVVHTGLDGAAAICAMSVAMQAGQRPAGASFFRLTVVRPTPDRPPHYPDGLYLEGWPERPAQLPPFADFPISAPPEPVTPAQPGVQPEQEVKLL